MTLLKVVEVLHGDDHKFKSYSEYAQKGEGWFFSWTCMSKLPFQVSQCKLNSMSPNVYSHFVLNLCISECSLSQSWFHPCLPYVAVKGGTSERPVGKTTSTGKVYASFCKSSDWPGRTWYHSHNQKGPLTLRVRGWKVWNRREGHPQRTLEQTRDGTWVSPQAWVLELLRISVWPLAQCVCVYHGRNQAPCSYRLQCRFRRA